MIPTERKPNSLLIHPLDNVAVALEEISAGSEVVIAGEEAFPVETAIPFAHKIAVRSIRKGEPVRKYGVPVAFATADINRGQWVHGHNAKSYFVAKREGKPQ